MSLLTNARERRRRKRQAALAAAQQRMAAEPVARPGPAAMAHAIATALSWNWQLFGFGLVIAAALFVGAGPAYLAKTQTAARMLAEVSDLPDASLAPVGARALLQGEIAGDSPKAFRHFVSYVAESYHATRSSRNGSMSYWAVDGGLISAFTLIDTGQRIRIVNSTYRFSPRLDPWPSFWPWPGGVLIRDWDHAAHRDGKEPGGPQDHERYRGLVAGEPVVVIATVQDRDAVVAEYVLAGTRADLIARLTTLAAGKDDGDSVAYAFMVVAFGFGLLVLAGWVLVTLRDARAILAGSAGTSARG